MHGPSRHLELLTDLSLNISAGTCSLGLVIVTSCDCRLSIHLKFTLYCRHPFIVKTISLSVCRCVSLHVSGVVLICLSYTTACHFEAGYLQLSAFLVPRWIISCESCLWDFRIFDTHLILCSGLLVIAGLNTYHFLLGSCCGRLYS